MTTNDTLSQFKESVLKYFTNSYRWVAESQLQLNMAQAFHHMVQAMLSKQQLSCAFVGASLSRIQEGLYDLDFVAPDPFNTFFDGDPTDHLRPSNPLEDIVKHHYDVVFIESQKFCNHQKLLEELKKKSSFIIDLERFAKLYKKTLLQIRRRNFRSCLSPQKLNIIAQMVNHCPDKCKIIEVGAYQCGTTIFMARFLQMLGKYGSITAFDMFGGIPPATEADKVDQVYYDEGMFLDNQIEKVIGRIKSERVHHLINLVKGDVAETLSPENFNERGFDLMLLDTDQYKGTSMGLKAAGRTSIPNIIVDDTSLSGVSKAINEFVFSDPRYIRAPLIRNFDLVFLQNS